MCDKQVEVYVPVWEHVPYQYGTDGRVKYKKNVIRHDVLMMRCSHNLHDLERACGYRAVDAYGRPILCENHSVTY